MPDESTMCQGENCPVKEDCYRFTAEVGLQQNVFETIPYNFETENCEYFWDNQPLEEEILPLAYQIWLQAGCPEGRDMDNWFQARAELEQLAGRTKQVDFRSL